MKHPTWNKTNNNLAHVNANQKAASVGRMNGGEDEWRRGIWVELHDKIYTQTH